MHIAIIVVFIRLHIFSSLEGFRAHNVRNDSKIGREELLYSIHLPGISTFQWLVTHELNITESYQRSK